MLARESQTLCVSFQTSITIKSGHLRGSDKWMPTEGWPVNSNNVGQYARTLINSACKESPVQ